MLLEQKIIKINNLVMQIIRNFNEILIKIRVKNQLLMNSKSYMETYSI